MKRGTLFLPTATILIAVLLYILPIQPLGVAEINYIEDNDGFKLDMALGPDIIEMTSGYNVTESDSYSYICTISNVTFAFNVSDIIRFNIVETNHSQTSWGWNADCIWSTVELYNSYHDIWVDYGTGNSTFEEYLIAGYNSTDPYSGFPGDYHCFIEGIDMMYGLNTIGAKIPHNWTAVNHSIVDQEVNNLLGVYTNVSFSTPTPGNIAGTWTIWSYDDGIDNQRYIFTYNKEGTLTNGTFQEQGSGDWITINSWNLITNITNGGEDELYLGLLLVMMFGGGGGIVITEIFIIAGIIGVIVVIIIIVAIAKSKG